MQARVGGDEGRGVMGRVMQGPGGILGKAHGALVPGTIYVLCKCEPSSLILGVGQATGGFNQGSEGSKSSFPGAPSC